MNDHYMPRHLYHAFIVYFRGSIPPKNIPIFNDLLTFSVINTRRDSDINTVKRLTTWRWRRWQAPENGAATTIVVTVVAVVEAAAATGWWQWLDGAGGGASEVGMSDEVARARIED